MCNSRTGKINPWQKILVQWLTLREWEGDQLEGKKREIWGVDGFIFDRGLGHTATYIYDLYISLCIFDIKREAPANKYCALFSNILAEAFSGKSSNTCCFL